MRVYNLLVPSRVAYGDRASQNPLSHPPAPRTPQVSLVSCSAGTRTFFFSKGTPSHRATGSILLQGLCGQGVSLATVLGVEATSWLDPSFGSCSSCRNTETDCPSQMLEKSEDLSRWVPRLQSAPPPSRPLPQSTGRGSAGSAGSRPWRRTTSARRWSTPRRGRRCTVCSSRAAHSGSPNPPTLRHPKRFGTPSVDSLASDLHTPRRRTISGAILFVLGPSSFSVLQSNEALSKCV